MIPMTLKEIAAAVGGKIVTRLDRTAEVTSVDTDSRRIRPGALFVAVQGENFDGNSFVSAAFAAGALAAVCEEMPDELPDDRACILVQDGRLALKDLATYYRKKFEIPFVAVTGSVGKTTTKDMIAAVMSQKWNVLKTEGNFNNDIGVPLTLFRLEPEHQLAVIEMGMNHPGEIAYLAEMVQPNLAVITNIGDAHIENLGSRSAILAAKLEVLRHLSFGGVLITNGDDPLLMPLKKRLAEGNAAQVILCGRGKHCDMRVTEVDASSGTEVTFRMAPWGCNPVAMTVPAPGEHMVYPAAMAAAVAQGFRMTPRQMRDGIASFQPTDMRMNVVELDNGSVLLNDAYNANPQSMAAAVEVLAARSAQKRIAVLGDMLELGQISRSAHESIGRLCAERGIDLVLTWGEGAAYIAQGAGSIAVHFDSKEQLIRRLAEEMAPETVVLVKASRGMHFEEVSASLTR